MNKIASLIALSIFTIPSAKSAEVVLPEECKTIIASLTLAADGTTFRSYENPANRSNIDAKLAGVVFTKIKKISSKANPVGTQDPTLSCSFKGNGASGDATVKSTRGGCFIIKSSMKYSNSNI